MKKIVARLFVVFLIPGLLLVGCGSSSSKMKDGTFTGVGKGRSGEIKVEVVIKGGKITDIKTVSQQETPQFWKSVETELIPAIIEKNSADVDAIAEATLSSNGVLEAVKDALSQAK